MTVYKVAVFVLCAAVFAVNGLDCWTCNNAETNADCLANGRVVECQENEQSCQTEIRVSNNKTLITKKCHQKHACSNNALQNQRSAWFPTQCNSNGINSVCRCCCHFNECNSDVCGESELPQPEGRSSGGTCTHVAPEYMKYDCNRKTTDNSVETGTTCSFSCPLGTIFVGEETVANCEEGEWDVNISKFYCKCNKKEVGRNVEEICKTSEGEIKFGDSCVYSCNANYKFPEGSENVYIRTCGENWEKNTIPNCYGRCEPFTVDFGSLSCTQQTLNYQSICMVNCDSGYKHAALGRKMVKCIYDDKLEETKWDEKPAKCIPSMCKALDEPAKGHLHCTANNYISSECKYVCNDGFELYPKKNPYKVCQANQDWLPFETPCCVRSCPSNINSDIVVILDSSSSIGMEYFLQMKLFVRYFISKFMIGEDSAKFAIFRYNEVVDASSQIYFNSYITKSKLLQYLDEIPYNQDGTKTAKALWHVIEHVSQVTNGRRENVSLNVIVLSDGASQDRVAKVSDILNDNAKVIALPLRKDLNRPFTPKQKFQLRKMTGGHKDRLITNYAYEDLKSDEKKQELFNDIATLLCGEPKTCEK